MKTVTQFHGISVAGVPTLQPTGLRLLGPPGAGVSFVDRWRSAPRRGQRVLCSEVLADQWGDGRGLPVPYRQWVKLGRLEVSLAPAGSSPEASVLHSRWEGQRVTCALSARWPAAPGSLEADLEGSDVLLLEGSHLGLPQSKDRTLLSAIRRASKEGAVAVWVDDPRIAIALSHGLRRDAVQLRLGPGLVEPVRRFGASAPSRWRAALRPGQVGLWFMSRRMEAPPVATSIAVLAHSDAGDWRFGLEPDLEAAEKMTRVSGAHTVLLWRSSVADAEQLQARLRSIQVLRLVSDPQLQLM